MNTSQDWLKVLNYRQTRKLENLKRFALSHCGIEIAEIRNGKLFVGGASYPDACEFILVDSLQELRDFLGY